MKTIRAAIIALAVIAANLPAAEEFKVPERTSVQKYNRLLSLDANVVALSFAHAKSRGVDVDEYAKFCGEKFAAGWNKQAGFAGFARGMLANFDVWRRDTDPPVEIQAQTESTIRLKVFVGQKRSFRDGKLLGASYEEYSRWFEIAGQIIAAHVGCTYQQETSGDFWIVTLAAK